ncbi:DNA translocase FtsK, partial [Candidatus Saccharibacteria bacterium]|nr:DNA translocase FtsK [Candidatus Saccharibacteria bacterium]
WQAIQIFRREDNHLPGIIWFATILFLWFFSGIFQLFLADPRAQAEAFAGNGGGIFGWILADSIMLNFFNAAMSATILVVLNFILVFFVLKISPIRIIKAIAEFFKREDEAVEDNKKVAKNLAKVEKADAKVKAEQGELHLNKGVPTVDHHDENAKNIHKESDKADSERSALTYAADPDWEFPSIDLLEKKQRPADAGDVQHNADVIRETLDEFNIHVQMEGANIGPKVTQYTLRPPSGVKLARITALENNLALNLGANSLRMEAPIPGQKAVGIEVPNVRAADVRLHGILESREWTNAREPLSFAIGRDISGAAVIGELNKMPHVLIAGQTGSGKSVMINSLLTSLLYKNSPSDLKLILVDPKQVEMAPYNDIPHLLTPVITEPEKCISALKWAVNEMERRYNLLAEEKLRDIKGYNAKMHGKGEATMPYVVVVIDELADLMMMAARDVEALIVRLAQKARAVGVHLVLATQRPSVDVITGLIKANIPARIAFTVTSQVDSRTILDQIGAEKLLGQGDMLLSTPSMSKPKRVQGSFVSDEEVVKITDHLRLQRPPEYDPEIISQQVQINGKGGVAMDFGGGGDDEYRDAVRVVIEAGKASTSLLQRRLRIGYSKAARIMEEMEDNGVIGAADGSRPRDVLVSSMDDLGE